MIVYGRISMWVIAFPWMASVVGLALTEFVARWLQQGSVVVYSIGLLITIGVNLWALIGIAKVRKFKTVDESKWTQKSVSEFHDYIEELKSKSGGKPTIVGNFVVGDNAQLDKLDRAHREDMVDGAIADLSIKLRTLIAYLNILLASLITYIVVFSEFLRVWYIHFGGFTKSSIDYWSWLGYGLISTVDSLLVNVTKIYDTGFSDLQPKTIATETFVFVFHAVLKLVLFSAVIGTLQRVIRERSKVRRYRARLPKSVI